MGGGESGADSFDGLLATGLVTAALGADWQCAHTEDSRPADDYGQASPCVTISGSSLHPSMSTSSPSKIPGFDRPWRASALVQASVVGHVAAAAAVAVSPPLWPWALGALALDHALITATGLWPRSTWLGANIRRLPDASVARSEVCLTIDDGPNPAITPAVLDLLDEHQARATPSARCYTKP